MLHELREVPEGERGARYRAVVALAWPAGRVERFAGTWEGSIGREPRGENGFGYDPIFRTADGRSGAELSAEQKDAVSHRGQGGAGGGAVAARGDPLDCRHATRGTPGNGAVGRGYRHGAGRNGGVRRQRGRWGRWGRGGPGRGGAGGERFTRSCSSARFRITSRKRSAMRRTWRSASSAACSGSRLSKPRSRSPGRGTSWPRPTGRQRAGRWTTTCAVSRSGWRGDRYAIFIHIANCGFGYSVGDNVSLVLAHEYFHILQLSLSPELSGPRWLSEGAAEYAMAQFGERANRYDYTAFRNSVLLRAASWTGTLRDAGDDLSYPTGHEHYFLGFLAIELLVEQAGEEAVLGYYRLLPTTPDWREAFASAFGTTPDEFLRDVRGMAAGGPRELPHDSRAGGRGLRRTSRRGDPVGFRPVRERGRLRGVRARRDVQHRPCEERQLPG